MKCSFLEIIMIIILFINTWKDMKTRCISLLSIGIAFVVFLICFLKDFPDGWYESIMGMLPGFGLAFFSFLSNGKIGMGDAVIIVLCGWRLGFYMVCVLLMISFVLTAMFGMILISLKKANRSTSLPFVPFIFLSYLLLWVGQVISL